ncbi:MAG: hypothetical protein H8F28_24440 [Fibrella sp.]|nr:hypothetical protein [Armatimonadota bacterium]
MRTIQDTGFDDTELGASAKAIFDARIAPVLTDADIGICFEGTVMWHGVARRVPILASVQGAIIGMRFLQGSHLFMDALDGGTVTITPRPDEKV